MRSGFLHPRCNPQMSPFACPFLSKPSKRTETIGKELGVPFSEKRGAGKQNHFWGKTDVLKFWCVSLWPTYFGSFGRVPTQCEHTHMGMCQNSTPQIGPCFPSNHEPCLKTDKQASKQATNQATNQPTNQLASQPTNQPTNQPISQPASQPPASQPTKANS